MARARGREPMPEHRRDTWSNESKEQMSLQMGSDEYKAYVRDQAGIDEDAFVKDDGVLQAGDERTPEEVQEAPPEPEHVAELAESLRQQSGRTRRSADQTVQMKYRRRMSKEVQVPDMKAAMIEAAAQTETKVDDAIAKQVSRRNSDDLPQIHDDGVSADEFVPRCFRKYMP